jgi:glutathione synthase/RimK-type ligase-like ATP-grasp enzyme
MGANRHRSPRIAGLTINRSVLTDGAHGPEVPPPRLGIYADLYPGKRHLFGDQTRMFADLVRYGEESGVEVAVLSPGYRRTELGWRCDTETGLWRRERVPLPDVVLRRSGRFFCASPELAAEDLDYFKAQGVLCTLPRRCSNKWAFYRMMSKSPRLRPHLPTTQRVESPVDILRFLSDHGDIYIKPVNGMRGESVHRLYLRNDTPVLAWEERIVSDDCRSGKGSRWTTTVVEREFNSPPAFAAFWQALPLRRCVVQETVPLPTTPEGRPFDFRWLVQMTDQWRVVARVARIGERRAVTTNIHTGAAALPAEEAAGHCDGRSAADLIAELDEVALAVADHLQCLHGPFAEVGIDLAVRPSGDIAIFEVNPTPGRRMLRSLPGNVREMSLRSLIEYAMRANRRSAGI